MQILPEYGSYKKQMQINSIINGIVALVAVGVCFMIVMISNSRVETAEMNAQRAQQNIVVVDPQTGSVVGATKQDISYQIRLKEYEDFSKSFYLKSHDFDKKSYEPNMRWLVTVGGQKGKGIFAQWESRDIQDKLEYNNLELKASIDSIKPLKVTNPELHAYRAFIFGTYEIRYPTGNQSRQLVVEVTLKDVPRAPKFLHGVELVDWQIRKEENID